MGQDGITLGRVWVERPAPLLHTPELDLEALSYHTAEDRC